jgi:pimeloyl-ACP methyl ester carboxylesterase
MPPTLNKLTQTRRRFLGGAAMTMLAARLGTTGSARAQTTSTSEERTMTMTMTAPNALQNTGNPAIRPFRVAIPQADLDDLRQRLAITRWPDKETVADGSQGAPLAKLQELVGYWDTDYDWRKVEGQLNALPQFITEIDGLDFHFLHIKSQYENALPLLVTHGWPGSVIEQLKIVEPLTDPTAHGGTAGDAFHLVIPSLPGYGFSAKPITTGWGPERIAQAWAELMKRLGYDRYVAQGGDWGSVITETMGLQAPAGLLGIHVNLPAAVPPDVAQALATGTAPAGLSKDEQTAFDMLLAGRKVAALEYFAMMTARPQALGYGQADSPAGLAAWVLVHPGFAAWAYGDDSSQSLSKDDVLDNATLYWLTNTATSAGRLYWENKGRSPVLASVWKSDQIALPVAISIFLEDAYLPPESWARRAFPTLTYYNRVPKGGHFAAWEQPELFAAELRAAFKSLR